MYKNSNHTMVLAIKKEAEAKIVFYREQIIAKVNKKSLIHSDQTVNKQLQAVQDQFKDYQLALYTLAFSSFLDRWVFTGRMSCIIGKIWRTSYQ